MLGLLAVPIIIEIISAFLGSYIWQERRVRIAQRQI